MTQLSSDAQISSSRLQLARYAVIGVASNSTIYVIYLLATYYGLGHKTAMTITYVIGLSVSFIGNKKWTFSHNGDSLSAVFRYVMAHLMGYFLNFLILFVFVDKLGYAHQWVQALGIIVVAGFLFVLFKYFVFHTNIKC